MAVQCDSHPPRPASQQHTEIAGRGCLAQERDAQSKTRAAATPSAVRTAWSEPHLSIIARLSASAAAGSIAMSLSFVGMTAKKVKGQLAIMSSAPSAHPRALQACTDSRVLIRRC
jgi:hypothetical protein